MDDQGYSPSSSPDSIHHHHHHHHHHDFRVYLELHNGGSVLLDDCPMILGRNLESLGNIEDKLVHRKHAELVVSRQSESVTLHSLGSNPTFVLRAEDAATTTADNTAAPWQRGNGRNGGNPKSSANSRGDTRITKRGRVKLLKDDVVAVRNGDLVELREANIDCSFRVIIERPTAPSHSDDTHDAFGTLDVESDADGTQLMYSQSQPLYLTPSLTSPSHTRDVEDGGDGSSDISKRIGSGGGNSSTHHLNSDRRQCGAVTRNPAPVHLFKSSPQTPSSFSTPMQLDDSGGGDGYEDDDDDGDGGSGGGGGGGGGDTPRSRQSMSLSVGSMDLLTSCASEPATTATSLAEISLSHIGDRKSVV
eukprot:TRINITY_DN4934_c0_g1_i1.p1 TRINITY_DN4934_c0_g1~~TRINITY_DN4934_c0_g1_i1.p1  ORF type:complete len:362 (-),score=92.95 TRINITY_DN4934_c0_g1_i1:122-1207(-)